MQSHPGEADLVIAALWAMCNLTFGSDERACAFRQLGALSAAKKAVLGHKGNPQLREVGAYIHKAGVQTKHEVMVLAS